MDEEENNAKKLNIVKKFDSCDITPEDKKESTKNDVLPSNISPVNLSKFVKNEHHFTEEQDSPTIKADEKIIVQKQQAVKLMNSNLFIQSRV